MKSVKNKLDCCNVQKCFLEHVQRVCFCFSFSQVFAAIDFDKDGVITCSDINTTDRFEWRKVSRAIDGGDDMEMQNTHEFEFGIIHYEAVW